MIKKVGIFLFAATTVFIFSKSVSAYVFSQTLKVGQTHPDVKELQKILNQDPQTRISSTGVGSSGQETTYFGQMTFQAVIKFQNKYASEVLLPAGLTKGTGFVGAATIKKLNSLSAGGQTTTVTSQNGLNQQSIDPLAAFYVPYAERINIYATDYKFDEVKKTVISRVNNAISTGKNPDLSDIVNKPASAMGEVFLQGASSAVVSVGGTLTLNGTGFTSNNTLYIGDTYAVKNVASNGGILNIKVPPVPFGRYDIAIRNSKGLSNTGVIVVTNDGKSHVKIDSIEPAKISYGQTLTLKGSGFTSSNDVITIHGIQKGVVSSDGTTISFAFTPENMREIAKYSRNQTDMSVPITIVNANGVFVHPSGFRLSY
ncbi:MAG: peptidoglycan-binding protein [Patescibacteria group bacterium]